MKTVLIVDDDGLIRELTARFLESSPIGLTVLTAGNGAEAVALLKTTRVDLVLTDLNMPVMDGFKLLAYISDKHPDIKKIAMTGLQSEDVREKLRFLGIRHCMEKPFGLKDLNEKIIQMLNDTGKSEPAYSAQQVSTLKPIFIRQDF
jgi:CheY-like chemotaxis protein